MINTYTNPLFQFYMLSVFSLPTFSLPAGSDAYCYSVKRFTFMERNEGVQSAEDLSKLALCHDVQLQHGLVVNLTAPPEAKVPTESHQVPGTQLELCYNPLQDHSIPF